MASNDLYVKEYADNASFNGEAGPVRVRRIRVSIASTAAIKTPLLVKIYDNQGADSGTVRGQRSLKLDSSVALNDIILFDFVGESPEDQSGRTFVTGLRVGLTQGTGTNDADPTWEIEYQEV